MVIMNTGKKLIRQYAYAISVFVVTTIVVAAIVTYAALKDYYRSIRVRFENTTIPVPVCYEAVLKKIGEIKYQNKCAFAKYLYKKFGVVVDPTTRFDVQVKRLHEYKRQLLES